MHSAWTGPIAGSVSGVVIIGLGSGGTVFVIIIIFKKKDEGGKDQDQQANPSHVCKYSCIHKYTQTHYLRYTNTSHTSTLT